ncbi:hypothetical protein F5876DRAFT_73237 [Lentinula aff. lateritia]|uniref:Uncharacterized protein n=1 Tax=Lentinula aff. lateritia TaxID=2804960 RepID=A0ACC1UAM6_9AGAR|nr:hypothetical protein F5876DRAFT_73237 [Lentinula aff. lateritia]
MVHTDIPHIRVNVSSSPLVSCYYEASGCSDYESTNEAISTTPSFPRLYSQRQALDSSSSYLLPNRPSASSSALSSSLSQSTLSSSQSDSQVLTANSRIPATAILALLDLLDAFDADVETQVAHLKENIKETHDKGIAPSLVAAKEKLQRSQLEDKLGQALQQRPKPEELVKEGILLEEEAPPSRA